MDELRSVSMDYGALSVVTIVGIPQRLLLCADNLGSIQMACSLPQYHHCDLCDIIMFYTIQM